MYLALNFRSGIEEAWTRIATFVPKFVGFLVILVIGYFIAKVIAKIVDRVLERAGFDRAVERGGLRRALERSKYEPSDILAKVVFWAAFLFVLQLAFGVFGPNPVSALIRGVIAFLPNVFVAIIILVITAALARVVTELLGAALGTVPGGEWMARGAGFAIVALGFFAALNQLHIAPAIVNGLFYAILALLVGSGIVAIGGGGIRTMQRYWERTATRMEGTAPQMREQAQGATERVQQRAQELGQEVRSSTAGGGQPGARRQGR